MERTIQRELLDDLPHSDGRAIRARQDLRRVNAWMRNHKIIARSLLAVCGQNPPASVADLGAGDGHFFARLARLLPRDWAHAPLTLVDQNAALAPDSLRDLVAQGWNPVFAREEVLQWATQLRRKPGGVVIASLFLHHLPTKQLRRLFELLERSVDVLVACEPRRFNWPSLAAFCVGLIGCSAITRQDAATSVRAGFCGQELSALWPTPTGWHVEERPAWPFSHLFVARRIEPSHRPLAPSP